MTPRRTLLTQQRASASWHARFVVLAVILAVVASGCASSLPVPHPLCDAEVRDSELIIEAQSVPSASQLPCVGALPIGWKIQSFTATDDGTHFFLDSDRAGARAVKVELREHCGVSGASRVPPENPGIEQYSRINAVGERYSGTLYYVFPGGCVTYDFDFSGEGRTELAREVTLALDFYPRAELESRAREAGIDL